ncbi:MAG: DinB family protein [Bernardetiaceae bacterium]|nr:DinB family protein [Bernardetiaceae bacterium]
MVYVTKFIFLCFFLTFQFQVFGQFKTKKYNAQTNLIHWPQDFDPQKSKFYIYNEIDIHASPQEVWDILIDAKQWHTFYKGVQKPVVILDSTTNILKNNVAFELKTMGLDLTPKIKEFIAPSRMAWQVESKNLQAYHAWLIVPTQKGCKLITAEAQNGFLTFLQKVFQPNKLLNLHQHWLEVIKQKAEDSTVKLTNIERKEVYQVLSNSLELLDNTLLGLNEQQLNYRSAPHKWTIAECIEHIALAELEFSQILAKEMQKPPNPSKRSKIKIRDVQIQPKMTNRKWRAKSPEVFKPTHRFETAQEALETFQNQRKTTLAYLKTTKDDLRNHFWRHPLTGPIDLYQTLLLMSAHLERHVVQINDIKSNVNFPK